MTTATQNPSMEAGNSGNERRHPGAEIARLTIDYSQTVYTGYSALEQQVAALHRRAQEELARQAAAQVARVVNMPAFVETPAPAVNTGNGLDIAEIRRQVAEA